MVGVNCCYGYNFQINRFLIKSVNKSLQNISTNSARVVEMVETVEKNNALDRKRRLPKYVLLTT